MNSRGQESLGITLQATYHKGDSGDDDVEGGKLESGSTDDGRGGQMESVTGSGMVGCLRVKVLVSTLELKSGFSTLELSRAT